MKSDFCFTGATTQSVTGTEFARNFSQMLDQVEHLGISISIVGNHKQVATVNPPLRRQDAMEAFGDLYRPLAVAVKKSPKANHDFEI